MRNMDDLCECAEMKHDSLIKTARKMWKMMVGFLVG